MSSFFKCGFFLHLITVATEWRDQQQNITGWCKIPDFSWFIYILTKKWRIFQVPYFIFSYSRTFPNFKDLWEPCIEVYRNLRGASIYKFSGGLGGPLTPRRFLKSPLAPRPIRWHFRLVRTLIVEVTLSIQWVSDCCQPWQPLPALALLPVRYILLYIYIYI